MDYPYHSPTKAQLRERIRKQRRALPPAYQAELDQQLVANLLELIDDHSTVAAYLPLPNEPGGSYLIPYLNAKAQQLWLPVCMPDNFLSFGRYRGEESLNPGPFGLLEPTPTHDSSVVNEFDTVIIPALALTPTGARLGQGAGFYDRTLAGWQRPIIGLVYSWEIQQFPAAAHDVRCTTIVTEKGTLDCPPEV
jgi:hypothetical protein